MDEGAWWATVHGVTKSQTQLSDFTSLLVPFGKEGRVLEKTPESLLNSKKSKLVNLKENHPEYSKGLMLKLQYFGHLIQIECYC